MKLTLDSIRALQSQGDNALGRLRNGLDELRNGNFPNFGGADFAGSSKDKANFSINAFMGNLISKDLALTSHFYVTMSLPGAPQILSFAACATSIPGHTLNTMEVRRYGVGPTYAYPIANSVPEIQITFYVDAKGEILSFFQTWGNKVFNMKVSDADGPAHYVASYKSEYVSEIGILLVDRSKDVHSQYMLHKAYPVQVSQTELAWGDSNIMRLNVAFRFDSYDYTNLGALPANKSGQEGGGVLNDIRQAFNEAGSVYDQIQGFRGAVENTVGQIRNINVDNLFNNISLENNVLPRFPRG